MPNVVVVPFVGALTAHPFMPIHDCNLLVQKAAQLLLAERNAMWLLSPAIIRGADKSREEMSQSPLVREVLEYARRADVTVLSVADADAEDSTLVRRKLLEPEEVEEMIAKGAVGEIGGHFFNKAGEQVPGIRPIGLDLEDLKQIVRDKRLVVAVVAGNPKRTKPLACALRAKIINVLVTDHLTAQALLAQEI